MPSRKHFIAAVIALFVVAGSQICYAGAPAEPVVVLDQIGTSPSFLAGSASSSQFPPDNPQGVFATVDNFSVHSSIESRGAAIRITKIEAVVTGLNAFGSFNNIISWNVQLYSSLSAASKDFFGDIYGKSFITPTNLTTGYALFSGRPAEVASFDVDVVLQPGDYWMTVAMENDGSSNGTAAIVHSTIGDGPCYFAVPAQGSHFALSNAAAYRVIGESVPTPGCAAVLLAVFVARSRRRE